MVFVSTWLEPWSVQIFGRIILSVCVRVILDEINLYIDQLFVDHQVHLFTFAPSNKEHRGLLIIKKRIKIVRFKYLCFSVALSNWKMKHPHS